jgi:phosphoserine phosphatase RsbU/P
MPLGLLRARLWLEKNRLYPQGRLAFVTCYLAALDFGVYVLKTVIERFRPSYASYLDGWVLFLSALVIALCLWLLKRWLSASLLWRVRNRLIVTYVFIGVIPLVLVVVLAGLVFWLLSGQFAAYVLKTRIDSMLRDLASVNAAVGAEIVSDINAERPTTSIQTPHEPGWVSDAWLDGTLVFNSDATAITRPAFVKAPLTAVAEDGGRLFLRATNVVPSARGPLMVVSSRPLDARMLSELSADLGEVTLYRGETGTENLTPLYTMGAIPVSRRAFDLGVRLATSQPVIDWSSGAPSHPAPLAIQTRLSKLYDHAFSSLGGDLAPTLEFVLFLLLVALALFEAVAWYVGIRLTRSVTGTVAQLYAATTHINRGDFSHRIPIQSKDQLAALAGSFNMMTESIEKLILEQKEKQRLQNEINIAQEVQAQLFPRHITQLPSLEVHGFCRPARSVSGDYYDFLPLGTENLMLAVGDVSGKGISAALLMATIHSAVRAYSMEGIPALRQVQIVGGGPTLVEQYDAVLPGAEVSTGTLLSLLNHQLVHTTPMEKYATMFLALYDGRQHSLTYSNAGHLPPLLLSENGTIRKLERGGTVVGLFDDLSFDEATVQLRPGEIFLAYSDGVTEPENDFGEFGEQRLIELVHDNRDLSLERISEIVTAAVDDWIGGAEQPDDVTLVLARAR